MTSPASAPAPVPPLPAPSPPRAVVAGALGLVSALLVLLVGSFTGLLWWTDAGSPEVDGAGAVAVVLVPLGLSHLGGAILVLCGRSPVLLVITAVPLACAAVVQVVVAGPGSVLDGPPLMALPLVTGLLAATAATMAVGTRRRGDSAARRPGALALPEEPWWP